jgi:hypothetical protein
LKNTYKKLAIVSVAGAALLSACGSASTTSASSTKPTSVAYASAYNGISDASVSSNGYPFSVPNDMRVPAPHSLQSAVANTQDAYIGSTYVGTHLTEAQRMEVYAAKMYVLYNQVFALPQYLATTGPHAAANKTILAELPKVLSPVYGSTANAQKLLASFEYYGKLYKGHPPIATGANTVVPALLSLKSVSVSNNSVLITVPAHAFKFYPNGASGAPETGGYTETVHFTPQPGNFRHLWPVSSVSTNSSS